MNKHIDGFFYEAMRMEPSNEGRCEFQEGYARANLSLARALYPKITDTILEQALLRYSGACYANMENHYISLVSIVDCVDTCYLETVSRSDRLDAINNRLKAFVAKQFCGDTYKQFPASEKEYVAHRLKQLGDAYEDIKPDDLRRVLTEERSHFLDKHNIMKHLSENQFLNSRVQSIRYAGKGIKSEQYPIINRQYIMPHI